MSFLSKEWADTIIELPTLTFHTDWLPLSIFAALHGIRIAMAYRQAIEQAAEQSRLNGDKNPKPYRLPFGQGLLSVLVMALGGGFTSSMLLGMPPSWLGSNVVVPTYTLSFVLVQYTALYEVLTTMVPPTLLDSVLLFADASQRGLSISRLGVDGSRMRFAVDKHSPGGPAEPWFAMLLLGTISGCGGGMWADVLKLKSHHWTWSTPSWAHAATWDMKSALMGAFFYATTTSPQVYSLLYGAETLSSHGSGGMMEHGEARAVTMLLMSSLLVGQRVEQTLAAQGYSMVAAPKRWLDSLAGLVASSAQDIKSSSKAAAAAGKTKAKNTSSSIRRRSKRHGNDDENELSSEEDEEETEEFELEEELTKIEQEQEEEEDSSAHASGTRALPRRRGRPSRKQEDVDESLNEGDEADVSGHHSASTSSSARGRKRGGSKEAVAEVTPSRTSTRRRKPTRQEL